MGPVADCRWPAAFANEWALYDRYIGLLMRQHQAVQGLPGSVSVGLPQKLQLQIINAPLPGAVQTTVSGFCVLGISA